MLNRLARGYEVVASEAENAKFYYHTQDEQGSTIGISDEESYFINSYLYDAFRNILESTEEIHNRIKYTGQQFDPITQQYYLRARFYNPVVGRFLQEDPYRGDGLNLYAYCKNNPVKYYDPSGYAKKCSSNKVDNIYGLNPEDIPTVKSGGFEKFFDSLSPEEFNEIWKDKSLRKKIERQLRNPGAMHEWLMVARANQFKNWGISAEDIWNNRSVIKQLEFVNPNGVHGAIGSGTAHRELLEIIDTSLDYETFIRRLNNWAMFRLPNGIDSLPKLLQRFF